jgi:hypothetical protein
MTEGKKKLQKKTEENLRLQEVRRRFYHRNVKAATFCNKKGLTIYASAQQNGKVKVFKQKGLGFLPINNIEYNQEEIKEVMEYISVIDLEYERMYLLKKDKD